MVDRLNRVDPAGRLDLEVPVTFLAVLVEGCRHRLWYDLDPLSHMAEKVMSPGSGTS